ncbi:MAG: Rpn family recombination-promoting nuclease/putative transposase [Phormidesmis sp.]
MFDTVCKFLIESFPADFATWLLGEPMELVTLSPSELSLEPIRADSLILLQSDSLVLHIEFQTLPVPAIPFRMLDYRIRVHRRFPNKQMRQVVIYLQPTQSELAWQTTFELENTQHRFEVIRLWEQPLDTFLKAPGLLPFAVLSQASDKEVALRQVAKQVQAIPTLRIQNNLTATAAILSALVLDKATIRRILRSDLMQESAIYQDIIEEGRAKGIAEGRAEGRAEGMAEAAQREKALILRLLNRRVGNVPEAERQQVEQLSLEQLENLGEMLLDFSSVKDLSDWLQTHPPSA